MTASLPALVTHARFITVEGGEGAGKTTVLNALRDTLLATGTDVVCTREPGGTPLAERIRALLLDPEHEAPAAETELLLMFAARVQHVRETILPALARGAWVVSDRFTDSSYAYQGGGRGLSPSLIAELEARLVRIRPGFTLLLDLGVHQGRERMRVRDLVPDRIEREQDTFFEAVRAAYLARADADPSRIRVVDASASAEDVATRAVALLQHYLGSAP
jgi:dTMP kinase